ncbi:MAG: patatin-like phospholipase family protein [Brevundimonas sp.]|uniref:patatin-like phospholipase family protein n=1 Tax=Brevundimonas sp. TaxID=1871086 RepID=UPI003918F31C
MARQGRIVAGCILLMALAACQTYPRVEVTAAQLSAASPAIRYDFDVEEAQLRFVRELAVAARSAEDGTVDLLALSGGGANGAFGAGVLNGWGERGDRPQFEIVTGVSTGALIAPFAFVGETGDAGLAQAFTDGGSEGLLRSRGLGVLFRPSVFRPEPLAQLVVNNVDEDLLRAVAEQHRAGRRLYVATTSLDTQTQIVWDMGALAQRTDDASRLLFMDILIASASIPVAFPPVPLTLSNEGRQAVELHVDGGTVANVLVAPEPFLLRPPDGAQDLTGGLPGRIWVIINGHPEPTFATATLSGLSVAVRSFDIMRKAITRADVARTAQLARTLGMGLDVVSMPEDAPDAAFDFSQESMQRSYEAGRRLGLDGSGWQTLAEPEVVEP